MTSKMHKHRPGAVAAVIGLALLAFPSTSHAAPFCVETRAVPPQCIFFDAALCNQRAAQMGGMCSANRAEIRVSRGLGHYCLLTSSRVSSCIYADRGDCDRDAKQQQGVCVIAPTRPESPAPDPYREIRPSLAGG